MKGGEYRGPQWQCVHIAQHMKSVVCFEVNRLPWNNTVTYVTRNGVGLVVGGMGTDKHRSALRRYMIQCFKHYEGWEGVHFPEKKSLRITRMAP